MMNSVASRGTLIVFEGYDRSGKTTVCTKIVEHLNTPKERKNGKENAKFMRFPDRDTEIGKIIDGYLKKEKEYDLQKIGVLKIITPNNFIPRKMGYEINGFPNYISNGFKCCSMCLGKCS